MVAKLQMENFFIEKHSKSMDARGLYIVQTKQDFRIVIGSECTDLNREKYHEYAIEYIKMLQEKEKAPQQIETYEQNNIPNDFWKLWNLDGPPADPFSKIPLWSMYF